MPARQNNDTDAVFARRVAGARREFAAALAGARGPNEPLELFSSEEEKIIQNGLDRLFYKRLLPNGGEKEQSIAKKLMKLLMQSPDAGGEPKGLRGIPGLGVEVLAEQYRETRGWYYTLKPLSDSAQARWMKREAQESSKAIGERNWDLIWFCKLRMEGIPTKIANFKMTCFFTLLRADSKRDRVVEIVTERGEKSPKLRLDAESFSTPSGRTGFRTWLMNKGNGCWKGGERELEDLQLDTAHDAAYMDVHEVTALGHDAASGLWFFEDCAFAPGKREDGSASRPYLLLLPDEDGVYWHEGLGYQLAGTGSGNQPFAQGLPVMHPKEVLSGEGGVEKPQLEKDKEAEWGMKFCLRSIGSPSPPGEGEASGRAMPMEDQRAVNRLFLELTHRLKEAIGGYDAYLILGSFFAFLARPEFFAREKCFPGLILHGETGQGKTTAMQWMMELVGFHQMSEGIGLSRNSTVVGMQILLEQYSSLPGWLSDFSNVEVTGEKQQIMHGAYNGALSVKWTADGTSRRSRTMFVVDGESRPAKTSTRYRYVQVLVSKRNRKSNQVRWFENNRRFFLPFSGRCCCGGRSSRGRR